MWNRHKKTQCNEVHAWTVHTAVWVLFNNWRFWTFTCWNRQRRQRRAYKRHITTSTSRYDIMLMWNYVTRVKVKQCGKNSRSGQIGACSHSDLMVSARTEFRWFQQFWWELTYMLLCPLLLWPYIMLSPCFTTSSSSFMNDIWTKTVSDFT